MILQTHLLFHISVALWGCSAGRRACEGSCSDSGTAASPFLQHPAGAWQRLARVGHIHHNAPLEAAQVCVQAQTAGGVLHIYGVVCQVNGAGLDAYLKSASGSNSQLIRC